MEFKWALYLFIFCFTLIPVTVACIVSERARKVSFFLSILLIPLTKFSVFNAEFFVRNWYRGSTRGIELNVVDLFLVALFISMIFRPLQKRFLARHTLFFWAFSILGVISVVLMFVQPPWLFSVFEFFKRTKGFLAFLVGFHFLFDSAYRRIFINTLSLSLIMLFAYALFQRYGLGIHRVTSFFWAPTDYAGFCAVFGSCLLACLLIGKEKVYSFYEKVLITVGFFAALTGAMLTIGRLAYFNAVLGFVISVLSVGTALFTIKRMTLIFVGSMFFGLMVAASYDRLQERFKEKESYLAGEFGEDFDGQGRQYYYDIAAAMIRKYPNGIGLNNWSWYNANEFGRIGGLNFLPYLSVDEPPPRLEDMDPEEIAAARLDADGISVLQPIFAHSTYLLYMCELGYVGLFIYLSTLCFNLFYWFVVTFLVDKNKSFYTGAPLLSFIFPALIVNFFEPILLSTQNLYLYYFLTALGAVMYKGYRHKLTE